VTERSMNSSSWFSRSVSDPEGMVSFIRGVEVIV